MSRVLPILFNTEMVRAILDGRKTVTRRVVKQSEWENFVCEGGKVINYFDKKTDALESPVYKAPFQPGDILYVRETWAQSTDLFGEFPEYIYRADPSALSGTIWRPSIHMPKDAARIWIKVTDVRVERLLEATNPIKYPHGKDNTILREGFKRTGDFIDCWKSTIKKTDLDKYGWDADPWVWVIEFERREKPEPCILKGIAPAEDKRPCIGYQKSQTDDEPCEMCKGCRAYNGEEPESGE